jgi:hypothetical protein
MGFELSSAVGVAPGVVERDPSLPELRRLVGDELRQGVEARGRLGDSTVPKIRDRAIEDGLGTLRLCLRTDWKRELDHHEELEDETLHFGRV